MRGGMECDKVHAKHFYGISVLRGEIVHNQCIPLEGATITDLGQTFVMRQRLKPFDRQFDMDTLNQRASLV